MLTDLVNCRDPFKSVSYGIKRRARGQRINGIDEWVVVTILCLEREADSSASVHALGFDDFQHGCAVRCGDRDGDGFAVAELVV